jgi:SepF-like predicted cell division protein (DUF552 family)
MSFFDRFRKKKKENEMKVASDSTRSSMSTGMISSNDPSRLTSLRKEENITYVKSLPLLSLDQVASIGEEIHSGNIIILDTEPMNTSKNQLIDLKRAIDQIRGITREAGGDLAQLGESHYIVITPAYIKIWERRSTPDPQSVNEESNEMIPSNIGE